MIVENDKIEKSAKELSEVALIQFLAIVQKYFSENTYLSTNGLAKKCDVSEPTLRRIKKGEITRLPYIPTVISLLSYIYKEKEEESLLTKIGPPLSDYIIKKRPQILKIEPENIIDLSQDLDTPTKYLIYKMASLEEGLAQNTLVNMFGNFGLMQAVQLENSGILKCINDIYIATHKSFKVTDEHFIENFKATAHFIKASRFNNPLNSQSYTANNLIAKINITGLKRLKLLQQGFIKKINNIINDPKYLGDFPVFILSAVDTLEVTPTHYQEKDPSL